MITLDKIQSSSNAVAYYSQLDDYYREMGLAPAELAGQGAVHLGIAGAVTGARDDASRLKIFGEVLAGRVAGCQVGNAGKRVAGWDLTVQAPKSYSVAAAHDARLRKVHDHADRAVFAHLEQYGITTRQRSSSGGYAWHQADVVALLARHSTNRNLDEHWHTHMVLASAVRDRRTGEWRSLDAREFRAIRTELEGIYQNALAHGAHAAGYTVDWRIDRYGNPSFELRDVPESLREAASSRRREIDKALAERGESRETASVRQRQAANRVTRQDKELTTDRATLHAVWRERALAYGYDLERARSRNLGEGERIAAADDAVKQAIAHLAERDARFSARDLAHEARLYAQGSVSGDDLKTAIFRAAQQGDLIARQSWGRTAGGQRGHRAGFTTRQGILTEQALLKVAAQLERGSGRRLIDATHSVLSERATQRAIAQAIAVREHANGRPMSDEQKCATAALLAGASRLHILAGHAGTAKTTSVLAAVAAQAQANGIRVRAMAPTSSAAGMLGDALGTKGGTVAAVLHEPAQVVPTGTRACWIVDEAGMISAKDMRDLLTRAEACGATVILTGDARQIGSVGAGAAYAQLSSAVRPEHHHRLTQIVRQTNATLREAVYAALSGRVSEALRKVDTVEVQRRDTQIQIAAERFLQATSAGQSALVVTLSRADRAEVNQEVHARRVASGEVDDAREVTILDSKQWTKAQQSDAARYQVGDVIVWSAAHRYGPCKGEQTPVVDSRGGLITIRRENGTHWTFNPRINARLDVADERNLEIGRGDHLVTRCAMPDARGQRLANGTGLEVIDLQGDQLTVRDTKGLLHTFDTRHGLPMDYGYAMTADQAQGRTVDFAIGVLRSGQEKLADQSRLYVAISRARHAGVVITDNADRLAAVLGKNPGQREAALETLRDPPEPGHLREWLTDIAAKQASERVARMPEHDAQPTRAEDLGLAQTSNEARAFDSEWPELEID